MMIEYVVPGRPLSQPRPRVTRRGVFNPAPYTAYKREAAVHAQVAALELEGRGEPWDPHRKAYALRLRFWMPDNKSTDIDKLLATQFDAITLAGLWSDDRYCKCVRMSREVDADDPRVEVCLEVAT